MDLSIVIPVFNEVENVAALAHEIAAALNNRLDYEIIFVDDCSRDETVDRLQALRGDINRLRIVCHSVRSGQSAAIHTGIRHANAAYIATLDGDGQNDPADLMRLWELRDADAKPYRMVMGQRIKRVDSAVKRLASQVANRIRGKLLRDDTPDTGCSLKLFPRDLFLQLPYFDHMHRFLGALVLRAGGEIISVPVNHRARGGGVSKYGVFDRLWVGIIDLIGVMWLQRRIPPASQITEV